MKLTIGLPCYNNFTENWFTVQALRMYQDLTDTEILLLDNFGDKHLETFKGWTEGKARYVKFTDVQGTAAAKNKIFQEAHGEWVFCIDSHVLLVQGAISKLKWWLKENPNCMDLLQGPLVYDSLKSGADSFKDVWSGGMWGQWHNITEDRNVTPYEIPMMGMGLFGCRKDAWLGFNPQMRGFGGEEGYIHEKYRKAGRKTLCLPFLQWVHHFNPAPRPYGPKQEDKIHNYRVGLDELGFDKTRFLEHFKLKE